MAITATEIFKLIKNAGKDGTISEQKQGLIINPEEVKTTENHITRRQFSNAVPVLLVLAVLGPKGKSAEAVVVPEIALSPSSERKSNGRENETLNLKEDTSSKSRETTSMENRREIEVPPDFTDPTVVTDGRGEQWLFGLTSGKLVAIDTATNKQVEITATGEYSAAVNPKTGKIELLVSRSTLFNPDKNIFWNEFGSIIYFQIGSTGKNPRNMNLGFMEDTAGNTTRVVTSVKEIGDGEKVNRVYISWQNPAAIEAFETLKDLSGKDFIQEEEVKKACGKAKNVWKEGKNIFVDDADSSDSVSYYLEKPITLNYYDGADPQSVTRWWNGYQRLLILFKEKYPDGSEEHYFTFATYNSEGGMDLHNETIRINFIDNQNILHPQLQADHEIGENGLARILFSIQGGLENSHTVWTTHVAWRHSKSVYEPLRRNLRERNITRRFQDATSAAPDLYDFLLYDFLIRDDVSPDVYLGAWNDSSSLGHNTLAIPGQEITTYRLAPIQGKWEYIQESDKIGLPLNSRLEAFKVTHFKNKSVAGSQIVDDKGLKKVILDEIAFQKKVYLPESAK